MIRWLESSGGIAILMRVIIIIVGDGMVSGCWDVGGCGVISGGAISCGITVFALLLISCKDVW